MSKKKVIFELTYDSEGCYKGHGEDVSRIIFNIFFRELQELVDDKVIKENWELKKL